MNQQSVIKESGNPGLVEEWNIGIVIGGLRQIRFHSTIIPVFHRSGLHLSGVRFQMLNRERQKSRWHSRTSFSASRRFALASASVSPCEIAARISSTKQVYPPSLAGSKTAVTFMPVDYNSPVSLQTRLVDVRPARVHQPQAVDPGTRDGSDGVYHPTRRELSTAGNFLSSGRSTKAAP